jgi:hypothetical protein
MPYRSVFSGLTPGQTYHVTISYGTMINSKHAIDYLTSYNQTASDADPCSGLLVCSNVVTTPIPVDPNVANGPNGVPGGGDDITPIPGVFSLWNGTNLSTSAYSTSFNFSGGSTTSIAVTFTASETSAVLAWGGHIATRANWGATNTSLSLDGSPYHMGLSDFWGFGVPAGFCPLELCLPRGGTRFPATLTIIKVANVPGGVTGQPFDFTASSNFGGSTSFTLFDNGVDGADRTTRTYLGATGEITVLENATTNWSLTNISCSVDAGGGILGSASGSVGSRQVLVQLNEGNAISCTFTNSFAGPTAANATLSGKVLTRGGLGIRGALVTVTNTSTGESKTSITNSFGNYIVSDLRVDEHYVVLVSAKRYTFSEPQQSLLIQGDIADINFTSDQ